MSTENTVQPLVLEEPICSTDSVWYKTDMDTSLSTVLDVHDAQIAALQTGKASIDHVHSGYAAAVHEHSGYASSDHNHTGYANANHSHSADYIAKALQMVSDTGDVKENLSNKDVLDEIGSKPAGMYTFYASAGSTNNPNASSSWRFLVHKTALTYGWVLAFGPEGVYENYLNGGAWGGWSCVYSKASNLLWQHPTGGGYFMNDTQTATPSKKLSECAHGWLLLWSDYDSTNNTASDFEFATTYIPKKMVNGADWSGQSFLSMVPINMSETTDTITIKRLYVHDNRITGHAHNSTGAARIDAVLRCIYEF